MENKEDIEKNIEINDENVDKNVVSEENTENASAKADNSADEMTAEPTIEEQLEAAKKEVEQYKDKYLRAVAEFDNYRKRTTKEKESIYSDAKLDTVKPFLDVADNLDRAVSQFEEGDPHRQGVEMICKQFAAVLEKLGVTEIEALGQPFDPEKHNAVMHIDDENLAENTVAEVFRKGYQMGDRVVRFAMVKVAN